ncbi:hypothetical protein [Nocardia sp. Marseille-Q1738]
MIVLGVFHLVALSVDARVGDDELSEEELIELNERRNQSWFQ